MSYYKITHTNSTYTHFLTSSTSFKRFWFSSSSVHCYGIFLRFFSHVLQDNGGLCLIRFLSQFFLFLQHDRDIHLGCNNHTGHRSPLRTKPAFQCQQPLSCVFTENSPFTRVDSLTSVGKQRMTSRGFICGCSRLRVTWLRSRSLIGWKFDRPRLQSTAMRSLYVYIYLSHIQT